MPFLDYDGLKMYDDKIKNYIGDSKIDEVKTGSDDFLLYISGKFLEKGCYSSYFDCDYNNSKAYGGI